jgi:3-hydroxyacyl-[acyl-carrier-protein] dehydratase
VSLSGDVAGALLSAGWEEDGQTLTAQFRFRDDLEVFRGHFPGRPLVPGAMQIEMVRRALMQVTGRTYYLARIRKAKFMAPVLPGDLIILTAQTTAGNPFQVKARLNVGDKMAASLVMELNLAA